MPLDLIARAVGLLPWRALCGAGRLVGLLAGSILRIRRRHVEHAIVRAGIGGASRLASEMYASLGTALFEFLWMAGRRSALSSLIVLTDRARVGLARPSPGKGLVVASAHTGNWDFVACAIANEIPLAVVTKRLHVGWLDRYWQRQRASRGIELIHGVGTLRTASNAIARGRTVVLVIDQAPERRTAVARASFLGETAFHDLSPALLAARTGTPLVLALGHRAADGTHVLDVPLRLDPPPRASRAWAEEATGRLNAALEDFVLQHPAQWLWLHRRWKGLPAPVAVPSSVC